MVPPRGSIAPIYPFGADLMTGATAGPPAAPRAKLEPTTALQWLFGVPAGILRTPLNTPVNSSPPPVSSTPPPASSPASGSTGGCCGG